MSAISARMFCQSEPKVHLNDKVKNAPNNWTSTALKLMKIMFLATALFCGFHTLLSIHHLYYALPAMEVWQGSSLVLSNSATHVIRILGGALISALYFAMSKSSIFSFTKIEDGIYAKYNEIRLYNEKQMEQLLFQDLGFHRFRIDVKSLKKIRPHAPLSVLKPIVARYMYFNENKENFSASRSAAINLIHNPTSKYESYYLRGY